MAQCQIRGGVHQRLPKRSRCREQLASVLHVLQAGAASSSAGLSNASAGLYEQIRRVFSNSCVLSYFRPKTVLTFGTTIVFLLPECDAQTIRSQVSEKYAKNTSWAKDQAERVLIWLYQPCINVTHTPFQTQLPAKYSDFFVPYSHEL